MIAEKLGVEKIPVLMVEDSPNEALIVERLLHSVDGEFTVSRVSRLKDAFKVLEHHKIDVLMLDLGLPDSSGPQSVDTLHRYYPDLPIVVLSGRNDLWTVRSALKYGAQEFLCKDECSGKMVRRALMGAIIRQSLVKKPS